MEWIYYIAGAIGLFILYLFREVLIEAALISIAKAIKLSCYNLGKSSFFVFDKKSFEPLRDEDIEDDMEYDHSRNLLVGIGFVWLIFLIVLPIVLFWYIC